jgi:hypothetical protein
MATTRKPKDAGGAQVDYLIDENASPVDVPDNSILTPTADVEASVGATAPTNWWQLGLIGLAIVTAILLVLQLLGGNPGTDVVPGTPVAAPSETAPPAG